MASSTPANPSMRPFGPTANAMTCTHIWRCTLFLLFGGHYDAALTCIRASASIATLRDVNVACGRNVAFFLGVLIEKKRNGGGMGREKGELDEELVAYVSGDLQGSTENSWVWQGSETGINLERERGTQGKGVSPTLLGGGRGEDGTTVLTDVEARDWGGWERVEYLVGVLAREQGCYGAARVGAGARFGGAGGSGGMGQQGSPDRRDAQSRSSERISIANII